MQSFKGLNIPADILGVLEEEGFENPSPVQLSVIPSALRGESVMAQSPTGSGKTLSYIVPILSRIDASLPRLQALVVVPTRELARQVVSFFEPFLKKMEGIRLELASYLEGHPLAGQFQNGQFIGRDFPLSFGADVEQQIRAASTAGAEKLNNLPRRFEIKIAITCSPM